MHSVSALFSLASFFSPQSTDGSIGVYRHFDLQSPVISFGAGLFCLFLGITAAILINLWQQAVSGRFVRALLKSGAFSEETAKTPDELAAVRFAPLRWALRHALRDGSHLRKTAVSRVSSPDETNRKILLSETRFYIPEEQRFRAEERWKKKGNDWPVAVAAIVLFALAFWLIWKNLPSLLSLLDGFLD